MPQSADIGTHPDIMELRTRYDAAAANPVAQLTEGLALLSGLYLAISPWIVGFNDRIPITMSNLLIGLVVALLALGYSSAFGRTYGISWITPLLGLWTIIAPWVIRGRMETPATITNNVIVGAVILGLGLAALRLCMTGRGKILSFPRTPTR